MDLVEHSFQGLTLPNRLTSQSSPIRILLVDFLPTALVRWELLCHELQQLLYFGFHVVPGASKFAFSLGKGKMGRARRLSIPNMNLILEWDKSSTELCEPITAVCITG